MSMPAWYDIVGLDERSNENCEGIDRSVKTLQQLLEKEHADHDIPFDRMCLMGFSQGGALSLYTGLQYREKLAGVVVLSGYLPHASGFHIDGTPNQHTPVLHCHGTSDMVVSHSVAVRTQQVVTNDKGATSYKLKSYPIQHTVSPAELADVLKFLHEILPELPVVEDDRDPTAMSVKDLKKALQAAGLSQEMNGFVEKSEFISLLQKYRQSKAKANSEL
jgi:predicted esterase